ncbi:integrase [Klebsiella pneumoniae]|uniref:Integrase n=1 Tax=Klebsiella pneumoniae TaxID=573 RepID=A0A2X3CU21_KLEPN|nr:integrase [Klebsiella pneumoniae]
MAYYSIEKRQRADGTLRYRCTVGVKEGGKYIYRENRTFSKQAHAKRGVLAGLPNSKYTGCHPPMT